MFTGLILEVGRFIEAKHLRGGRSLSFSAPKLSKDLKIGDSVSVNGVCQTVSSVSPGRFACIAVLGTLQKTTFSLMVPGEAVNLESALQVGDSLDGHIVQGHVNGTAKIASIRKNGETRQLSVKVPASLWGDCIEEGSIAVNGTSLTITRMDWRHKLINIHIIPHTWEFTNLRFLKSGTVVNVETDMLLRNRTEQKKTLNMERLQRWGY